MGKLEKATWQAKDGIPHAAQALTSSYSFLHLLTVSYSFLHP